MAVPPAISPSIPDADELIDAILAEKGPAVYKDGLSEDNWEEELEQIPLFMTKAPDPETVAKSPGLSALQEIKYQEETPEGRATMLKEDGNEMFKRKKYKEAIELYTAGLAEGSQDAQLNAVLHCNRAAAHYYIGNYRSSITDASQCKSIKPDHIKAYIKGAESTFKLGRYHETLDWCEEGLKVDPSSEKLSDLKKKATVEKKKQERDDRKQQRDEKRKRESDCKLIAAIKTRGIRLAPSTHQYKPIEDDGRLLELLVPQAPTGSVRFDDDNTSLVWPVLFLYPEYGTSDLIESFHEQSRFIDHINLMFGEGEEVNWDHENKYKPHTIEVWYEDYSAGHYVNVPLESTLSDVINHSSKYVVICGSPAFFLIVTGSSFSKAFLSKKTS